MKLHNRNVQDRADLGGAMTDISFLLIVFFLVTAVFVTEDGLLSQLPELDSVPKYEEANRILQIEMREVSSFAVDGNEFTDFDEVQTFIEEKAATTDTIFGVLFVKEGIEYGSVVQFISRLKEWGVAELTISSGNNNGEQSIAFPVALPNIETGTVPASSSIPDANAEQ